MKGSIRRRSKNSWQLSIDLGRDTSGKRLRKFVTVQGQKSDAQRKLREILSTIDKGIPVDGKDITVSEFLRRWLADYVSVNTRPRTYQRYESDVRLFLEPAFGSIKLSTLSPWDVQNMESNLLASGKSNSSVRHIHAVLKNALRRAMRWGLIHRNVADLVDAPRQNRTEVTPPTREEVGKILRVANETEYGPVLSFMVDTGCRRGEALAFSWDGIDLDMAIAYVSRNLQRIGQEGLQFLEPKSKQSRRPIKLGTRTVEMLREHRGKQLLKKMELSDIWEDNNLVFPGPMGKPLDPATLTRNFIKLVRGLGLKNVRLHDLRHFHATQMYASGLKLKDLQHRLGHSSIAITADIYTHADIDMQTEAVKAFEDSMSGL